ncbi:hypothetical protein HPB52_021745 [Rhipicephalus sanguineus]|uniref:Uncharacterized protein n=1 Tax=Rhipicephalus sanguineus TaxID=34632 RepID=A0A9D4T625_RHISA|nr:hypothetical protein HPB52_021745 [Rhipicephalus sanguineus]
MEKAVIASYHHITSNDEEPKHSLCPDGPDSWCRLNAAKAKGQPVPKHHYNLPSHVGKALLPIYQRLSDKQLLEWCQRGRTQKNESLHSLIWALTPKERHASLFSIEAAVAEAVLKFNAGCKRTSASILHELCMNPGQKCMQRMEGKDQRCSAASERERASAENVQCVPRERHKGASAPGAY